MPKKPIVFGIGVGLIFACLTFFYLYSNRLSDLNSQRADSSPSPSLTDEEIMLRAAELGMTFITPEPPAYQTPDISGTMHGQDDPPAVWPDEAGEPFYEPTIEPAAEPETEPEAAPTEEPINEPIADAFNSYETPAPYIPEGAAVLIRVPEKATATEIAWILRDAGVIENVNDFLQVLISLNYTQRMAYGSFNIVPGTDYYTIAEMMVRKSPR